MKKILNKMIKTVIVLITVVLLIYIKNVCAFEESNIEKTNLYSIGMCEKYLKYNNRAITTTFVVYKDNNIEYPVYCLNVDLPGVGELGEYEVDTKEKITDVGLWRVIINGYPYKNPNELGVDTKEEAYTATKQAIYCYLYGRGIENYAPNGDNGVNTYNALNLILQNSIKEESNPMANIVDIITNDKDWKEDDINSMYVSKTYTIKENTLIKNYSISGEKLPEGALIVDEKNNIKSIFEKDENFKVLIPIYSLKNNGNFILRVEAQMDTKPIILGKSMVEGAQNYALTGYFYENVKCEYSENFQENNTKIKIYKKDKENNKELQGVEFKILDEYGNIVFSNLVTNEKGEIVIEKVMPGKYFLQEVRSLQGYVKYDKTIELKVNYNEVTSVIVNNIKEPEIFNQKPDENEIFVNATVNIEEEKESKIGYKEIEQKIIRKLPVTGM